MTPKTKSYFKTCVLEGHEVDKMGEIKSLRVMVARMHLYLGHIKQAESLLVSSGRTGKEGTKEQPSAVTSESKGKPTTQATPPSSKSSSLPHAKPPSYHNKNILCAGCGRQVMSARTADRSHMRIGMRVIVLGRRACREIILREGSTGPPQHSERGWRGSR